MDRDRKAEDEIRELKAKVRRLEESRDAAETRTRKMCEQIDVGRQRIASLPSLSAMERELQTLRTRTERAEDREHRLNAWLKKILADEWYETSDSPELNGQCCFTVPNIL